eukprot:CAMPEP_0204236044 /NCGR_PEP_ID=MMETSP0361-20130328/92151_1 /ASSEMBLY_ACC=CAM_ASM_000343 /TAXON_ID=268821 /ORGANISM="Scrippsiella Hangoei, Strain SHTV-5" /LENGTH=54 /DNA_ID=CAMNT_0051207781 /DNA_START=12 /DNA_END=172 /DNA_ORIENTATION=+
MPRAIASERHLARMQKRNGLGHPAKQDRKLSRNFELEPRLLSNEEPPPAPPQLG